MMKTYLKAFFGSLPIWILLIVDSYLYMPNSTLDKILMWLSAPGFFLLYLLSPTWKTIHDTEESVFIVTNCLIYYGLIYLILFLKKRGCPT